VLWSRFFALAIAAVSPLASAQTGLGELRDIAPPVEMPDDPVWHLYLAGAIVALSVVAGIVFAIRRKRPAPEAPPVPPHRTALEALRRLEDSVVEPRIFYTRLTEILRAYIAGRFGIDEPDATASELLAATFRSMEITPQRQSVLRALISEADLVKFAGRIPAPDAPARAMRDCRDFILETALEEKQLAL
jgi:hypothetical protein